MARKYDEDIALKKTHPEWYDKKGDYIHLKLEDLKDDAVIRLVGMLIKESLNDYVRKIKPRKEFVEFLKDDKHPLKTKVSATDTRLNCLNQKHEAYLFFTQSEIFKMTGFDPIWLIQQRSKGRINKLVDVDPYEYVYISSVNGTIDYLVKDDE